MAVEKYKVDGMTCAACSANVERAVKKVPGVENVSVSLLNGSMRVDGMAAADDIARAVEKAGYAARLFDQGTARPAPKETEEAQLKAMRNRLLGSLALLMPLMYLSMGHMVGLPLPAFLHGPGNELSFAFTQLLLSLPIALINQSYFTRGFRALFHKSPNMDSLIAIGSAAAYLYGVAAIYAIGYGMGHALPEMVTQYAMQLYFESGAMILTLITLGKYFETRSKGQTGAAIRKLIDLAPKTALIERDGAQVAVSLEEVRVKDVVLVKPGSGIPVDGVVLSGVSAVDESAMTGESIPVEVSPGSPVRAGTMNGNGSLRIEAQRVGSDTTLSQIVRLVEEASGTKAPIAKLADKIAGVFVPVVIAIALITAGVWLALGAQLSFALNAMIAVLVISCPCALGLATPVAVMVGTGRAATLGILFKNAEALEKAHLIKTVVLDKTGTLTRGKPRMTDAIVLDEALLDVALSLEKPSGHPLSAAIVEGAVQNGAKECALDAFEAVPGRGVRGVIAGKRVLGGNREMMAEAGVDISALEGAADRLSDAGRTPMYFARGEALLGLIAVADVAKPDSARAVAALNKMGIETVMLTGDNERTARALAREMGITRVIAGVLPADKEMHVRAIQEKGGVVAMVGDGVNDAPALTRADVGIAIGAGSDIALESADVVLVKSSLMDAVTALKLSRAVLVNIKENLFWAFFYNATLIPLAAGVFYHWLGWALNPMIGAAAMSLSSVCVVANALRLFRFKAAKEDARAPEEMPGGAAVRIVHQALSGRAPDAAEGAGSDHGARKQEGRTENKDQVEGKNMEKTLSVSGMMCGHCKAHVEKALNALDGVTATVDLDKKTARVVMARPVSDDALRAAVTDAGYQVEGIE
ncbi:MAG: heavy metal translocating P-type ATPase [Clostridia bacterium]